MALGMDMFPPTDSAKRAFDVFPTTDNIKDINPPRSLHVVIGNISTLVGGNISTITLRSWEHINRFYYFADVTQR